jgi:NIMA (never in mitosis gene a)-related kinase
MHGCVSSANILLKKAGDICNFVKVAYFKKAANADAGRPTIKGRNAGYLPPEVLRGADYSQAADIWGLGVLLFELAAMKMPFDSRDPDNIE